MASGVGDFGDRMCLNEGLKTRPRGPYQTRIRPFPAAHGKYRETKDVVPQTRNQFLLLNSSITRACLGVPPGFHHSKQTHLQTASLPPPAPWRTSSPRAWTPPWYVKGQVTHAADQAWLLPKMYDTGRVRGPRVPKPSEYPQPRAGRHHGRWVLPID